MKNDDGLRQVAPTAIEVAVWRGHPSQWIHFWFYLFCLLIAVGAGVGIQFTQGWSAIGFGVALVLWCGRWWLTRSTDYELTNQRLKVHTGILNRRLEEVELYRVKDYLMDQPLFLRMIGRGNITLVTSDASARTVVLRAVARVTEVREQIRQVVQSERDRKRVRELDIDDAAPLV